MRQVQMGPPSGGPSKRIIGKMRQGAVNLEALPGVKLHFARIRGRARSGKVIMDHDLHARATKLFADYEAACAGRYPQEVDTYLSVRGLTTDDLEMCKAVLANPWEWERSIPKVHQLWEALAKYGSRPAMRRLNEEAYAKALAKVRATFGRGTGDSVLHEHQLVQGAIPFQAKKSSGFPMMRDKASDESRGLAAARNLLGNDRMPSPCVASVRVQQKQGGSKTRLVFAYPMEMTLLEGMFAPQLIEWVKDRVDSVTYAEGPQEVAWKSNSVRLSRWVVETDFSSFDASISSRLIEDCFAVLATHFNLKGQSAKAWERVVAYFVNTPIIMPDAGVYMTEGGVPSGSWFTNLIDSMVNLLFIEYAAIRLEAKHTSCAVLGDDALIGFEEKPSLGQLSEIAQELALDVSAEKSRIVDNTLGASPGRLFERPYYLGHFWLRGVWYRPVHVTLARLLYHERFVGEDPDMLRASRLLAHGMDNPLAVTVMDQLLVGNPDRCFAARDCQKQGFVTDILQRVPLDQLIPYEDGLPIVTGAQQLARSMGIGERFQPSYASWAANVPAGSLTP